MTEPRLPPGTSGLPLLGETIPFIGDMFGFIQKRVARHGRVFRSNLLGNPTVFITGSELTDTWLDDTIIMREGSFPKNIQQLFGGRSLPLLDGQTHHDRKRLIMTAMSRGALTGYLPVLEGAVERSLARAVAASAKKAFAWLPEMKRLAIEGILQSIVGLLPGEDMDAMLADYGKLARGFTGLPINVPGTDFHAALAARDRIFARLRGAIAAHRKEAQDDGLGLLLRSKDGPADEDLIRELHHMVIAGLIIFAELACVVTELTRAPAIKARIEEEVCAALPKGTPMGLEALMVLPYLDRLVLETKRYCPNVPVSFGRAKKTFDVGGFTVPEGWLVFMAVGANNMDEAIYSAPRTFDPDRFSPERAEHLKHPHAYQPQGAGSDLQHHRCAGVDFSTLFMKVFIARVVRDVTWTLPEQDLSLRGNVIPPEPKDGLLAVVTPR